MDGYIFVESDSSSEEPSIISYDFGIDLPVVNEIRLLKMVLNRKSGSIVDKISYVLCSPDESDSIAKCKEYKSDSFHYSGKLLPTAEETEESNETTEIAEEEEQQPLYDIYYLQIFERRFTQKPSVMFGLLNCK